MYKQKTELNSTEYSSYLMLMRSFFKILIAIAVISVVYYIINRIFKRNWLKNYSELFYTTLNEIMDCVLQFNSMTSFERGYFSNNDLLIWKVNADKLLTTINSIPGLKKNAPNEYAQVIIPFRELVALSDVSRQGYNEKFIDHELKEKEQYFSTILSNPLDSEQRKAIVVNEDHNLVIAGAGCGKTTTVAGKVKYIIDRYKVIPEEIVLISFTKKSSEEMDERINGKLKLKTKVQTFHSLGLEVIGQATGKKPSVVEDALITSIINNCFSEQRKNDNYLNKLNHFFLSYLKTPPEDDSMNDEEDLRSYLKGNDITSLNQIPVTYNGRTTYERQFCRSYEEVLIANFLFVNQIKYQYEPSYQFDAATADFRQYKPDFYLPDYGIYIEHYGIDEKGNVPKWFGNNSLGEFIPGKYEEQNKKYKEKIKWADEIHRKYKTILVKTFSWENRNKILLSSLEEKLRKLNVQFRSLDPKQVWATIVQSAEKDVMDFEILLRTFLTLFKSNNVRVEQVKSRISKLPDGFQKERASIFLDLFSPVYNDYEVRLRERKEIDFNDMINNASQLISNGKYTRRVQYIIVDEFQDISFGRYNLLKSLLNSNPGCKLFCVGDDWQSIYRFTGSDISLFTEFEHNFGVTKQSQITSTYRFSDELIKVTSDFIQRNPNQIKKKLRSKAERSTQCLQILSSRSQNFQYDVAPIKSAIERIIADIDSRHSSCSESKVLVLGRYNHDRKIFQDNRQMFRIDSESATITYLQQPDLRMHFLTIHAAKGLEADYVIILNCNTGKYGFPSERADDQVLNLLLSNADRYENGEERRLFYVALTRTKRCVYLITSDSNPSKFVKEIRSFTKPYQPPKPSWDDLPF